MYPHDRRKTEGCDRTIWPPDWHSETHHGYAGMFGLSHCEFYSEEFARVPTRTRLQEISDITKKLGRAKQTTYEDRTKTYLNEIEHGSTDVENHQASWPTVGPLQGDGTPYNSQELCNKRDTEHTRKIKKRREKNSGDSKSTCKRANYYVHKLRKISPKMICNIDM